MNPDTFQKGQRWVSQSEPELGLGTLIQSTGAYITIQFPAAHVTRQYARDHAPLKRVRFRPGDTITTQDGQSLVVESVADASGLILYTGQGRDVPETLLSDRISVHGPEDRLLAGYADDPEAFQLRIRTWRHLHAIRKSPVRGFVGGRIDLIPHQLYIAHEVSSRQAPRVLLSDEIGLGKTIEACLILHRLLLSGRVSRVLILVPDSLVHQWFVEMLRKFNLWLHIFDEERCAAIQAGQPRANPFLDDQIILCSLDFLAGSPPRARQAIDAGWDMLVVDEAHHLQWAPDQVSPEYALVEALSRQAEGLLLLTATPEQLGPESHFARLSLLDPDRYQSYEHIRSEPKQYQAIAHLAEKIRSGNAIEPKDKASLKRLFPEDTSRLNASLQAIAKGDPTARTALWEDVLDLHGPGRVLFRNTRNTMSGFPKRKAHLIPLKIPRNQDHWIDQLSTEFAVDAGDTALQTQLDLQQDPRVAWLARLLRQLAPEKILLICRSREKVLALEEALRRHINVKAGIFHEGLTLLQRDRNAAWFAGEDDVRLLLCSEIGSEGRNFQFAHHLVLFDLPLNPELLEQRIGRLDRIGQTQTIHIYVPYLQDSPQEILARWYQEGLDAFQTNLEGGNELLRRFGRQVHDLALEYPAAPRAEAKAELKSLLQATAQAHTQLLRQLEQGRDRLLEMNSFRPQIARQLVTAIRREDQDDQLEQFMLDVFEHFGVHTEELAPQTYFLNPQGVLTDAFPSIPEEGLTATFDRSRALSREEVGFLTQDHPIVTGAMELILSSEKGNCTVVHWPDPDQPSLLLETLFVLETVAEGKWHLDRFLPPTPVRVIVNHQGQDVTDQFSEAALESALSHGHSFSPPNHPELSSRILPAMLQAARTAAEKQAPPLVQRSLQAMNHLLDHEIQRLVTLQKINDHVRPQEIQLAREQQHQLTEAIRQARLRLDAVRLIYRQ